MSGFRVVCIDASPCNPGMRLAEMKSYWVEGFINVGSGPRYLLKDVDGSWPATLFITGTVEHQIEMEIFLALNKELR